MESKALSNGLTMNGVDFRAGGGKVLANATLKLNKDESGRGGIDIPGFRIVESQYGNQPCAVFFPDHQYERNGSTRRSRHVWFDSQADMRDVRDYIAKAFEEQEG